MPFSVPRTLLTALLMSTSLLACSDKKSEAPATQDSAQAGATAAGTGAQALVDYWKPISMQLAGTYGGNCTSKPDGKQETGHIVITPDGTLTALGASASLVKSAQTTLTHRRTEGGPSALTVEGIGNDFMVKLTSGDDGQGHTAVAGKGQASLSCEKSKEQIALTGKSLYTVYAKELDAAPRTIRCVKVGELKMSDLNYQFSNGVAKLQEDNFDLAKMDEHLALMNGSSVLSYTASTDASEINIILDKFGKLISVQAKGKSGQVYSCPIEG